MTNRINPGDLERKLREIQVEVDEATTAVMPAGVAVGVGLLMGTVGVAYILGQRKAHKRTTVVEIRRV